MVDRFQQHRPLLRQLRLSLKSDPLQPGSSKTTSRHEPPSFRHEIGCKPVDLQTPRQ